MNTRILIIDDTVLRASASVITEESLRASVHEITKGARGSFMYMPGGVQPIACGTGDRARPRTVEVEVLIDPSSADVMRAQLAAIKRNHPGQRPFIDFFHENKEAGFWPEDFFWAESPKPGVYVTGEWSAAGKEKVEGKVIRGFSPEFRVDDTKKKPARLRCSEYAGLNLGGFTNTPAFKDNLPLWAQHAAPEQAGVVNKTQNKNTMTKEQLAALKAQKLQLEQEIDSIRAQGHGPEELAEALGSKQNDLALLAAQIESGENALRASAAEGQLLEQRRKDAKAAVAAAVKRGAIGAKDEALIASWEKKLIEDPENAVLLASTKGFVNLAAVQAPAQRMIIRGDVVRADNESVLRAMSACQARQTPGVAYAEKISAARELAALYAAEILPRIKEGDDVALRGSNSLGTLASTIVSIRTLELLQLNFPMFKAITTDFSDEVVKYNETRLTRYITIPSVQTFNTTTGWPTNSDHVASDVSITYNQYKGVPISIISSDISSSVRRLFDEIAPAQAYALGKNIVDYVYALITSAFTGQTNLIGGTNTATEAGAPTFGRASVIQMGAALNKMGVPTIGRTLLLNQDYYSALASDQTIITMAAFSKNEIIEEGTLPRIEGMKPINAVNLPATAISGTKLLQGFAFSKSALVLGTRLAADYVNVLPGAGNGNLQVVTTPGGFSANQVQYVNHSGATANQRLEVIYGASRGQLNAGQLLTNP